MKLVLRIPYPTPSNNELVNRRHRFAYTRTRAKWLKRVRDAYLEAKVELGRAEIWPRPPRQRIRVTVERLTRRAEALDQDNLLGGLKPLLDALRKMEFIDDDSYGGLELVTRQPKAIGQPAAWTQVTLEPIARED